MSQAPFTIVSMILAESGQYNDQMLRPYQSVVQHQQLAQLQEATHGGDIINETTLAGVAGQILRPSAQPVGVAICPNGWAERRFRFLMRVQLAMNSFETYGGREVVIAGYTDYTGITRMNHAIDPNMKLYFNTSVILNNTQEMSATGIINRVSMAESAQIIRGEFNPIVSRDQSVVATGDVPLRPEDVYQEIRSGMYAHANIINDSSTFAGGIKKSRRSNNDATKYLSTVLNAYQYAVDCDSSEQINVLKKAQAVVREPLISADEFLYRLQKETQIMASGCVTWGELCHLNPHLESVTRVTFLDPEALAQTNYLSNSAALGGATPEVVAATIIANAIPGMMMDHMMVKAAFMITNETMGMEPLVTIAGYESFVSGMDITGPVGAFKQLVGIFVDRELTINRQRRINLQVIANAIGDTTVTIGFDGYPPMTFVLPSFCDAVIAPVVAPNRNALKEMAVNMSTLANNMSTVYGDSNGAYSTL